MKYLVFTLRFPNPPTWNGHWSGENDVHVVYRKYTDKAFKETFGKREPIWDRSHCYRWPDGWTAVVDVNLVDSVKEKNALTRHSRGFCGYDWMVSSLIKRGTITVD